MLRICQIALVATAAAFLAQPASAGDCSRPNSSSNDGTQGARFSAVVQTVPVQSYGLVYSSAIQPVTFTMAPQVQTQSQAEIRAQAQADAQAARAQVLEEIRLGLELFREFNNLFRNDSGSTAGDGDSGSNSEIDDLKKRIEKLENKVFGSTAGGSSEGGNHAGSLDEVDAPPGTNFNGSASSQAAGEDYQARIDQLKELIQQNAAQIKAMRNDINKLINSKTESDSEGGSATE